MFFGSKEPKTDDRSQNRVPQAVPSPDGRAWTNPDADRFPPDKNGLRRQLLAKRDAIPPEERRARDEAIVAGIVGLAAFTRATAALLYVPVGSEINVWPLAREAWRRGIPVGFPVCDRKSGTLTFRRAFADVPLVKGAFGIPIPPEDAPRLVPDAGTLCVPPALGYDQNRVRIGYGGGYYDRFLAVFSGVAVGAAYRENVLPSVFAEAHDRPVSVLVTENGIL